MITYSFVMRGPVGPQLTLTVDGVHDVGRVLSTLAHGNVEHASVARDAATELRRTKAGRSTLEYLERHGGPVLGSPPNTRCPECGHQRYVPDEAGVINCPECPYGSLDPRNTNYAEDPDQEKQ